MIDFKKELDKFNFLNKAPDVSEERTDVSIWLENFNSTLKRIGKEQNETNMQIEEIMIFLDHETKSNSLIKELQSTLAQSQKTSIVECQKLIDVLLTISDQIEDLYHYSLKHEHPERSKHIKLLWDNIGTTLISCGITRIDQVGVTINLQICIPIQIRYDDSLPEGLVLEVLKSGYLYNSEILRKAQVTVNKKEKAGNLHE
ncbi:nucleotide exchange factor GrpE [Fusibacter sp. 3D3]|uniref:nucleotide exchange factor GrpE n=1 Tax=Fusibacter sp. 3D3 TaxID=1048380 RepID=UPI000853CEC2|nr:nucleotide exchange factor GrpE [Fusibacter sp. 3D3]GAU77731.1 heat shock protein GrpE [Fusibacter sp. 3D3]